VHLSTTTSFLLVRFHFRSTCVMRYAIGIGMKTSLPLHAITTTHGNVPVDYVDINIRKILYYLSRVDGKLAQCVNGIELFSGAQRPLVPVAGWKRNETWPGHGSDGLGDVRDPAIPLPPPSRDSSSGSESTSGSHFEFSTEHAASALVRLARQSPGEIRLVAVGPLTNVALALGLDPSFLHNLHSLVIMGGTTASIGNVTPAAEFNFHCDPEAAHVVLEAGAALDAPEKVMLVPWEPCVATSLSWQQFDSIFPKDADADKLSVAHFIKRFIGPYEMQSRTGGDSAGDENATSESVSGMDHRFAPCDAYAVAVAMWPDEIIDHAKADCLVKLAAYVELQGRTRGGCFFDWYRGSSRSPLNVQLVKKMNADSFYEKLKGALADQ